MGYRNFHLPPMAKTMGPVMAGTDRRQKLITDGPVIILVNPQLGQNIGAAARAMANFGLSELRLVDPRDGWPNEVARANAAKADHIIDGVKVFDTLEEALSEAPIKSTSSSNISFFRLVVPLLINCPTIPTYPAFSPSTIGSISKDRENATRGNL